MSRYEIRACEPFGGWGVWCNHRRWWATLDGVFCYGMTRWEARQVLGFTTGENVR